MIRITAETVSYSISRQGLIGYVVESVQGVLSNSPPAINKLVHIEGKELAQIRQGAA